MTEQSSQLRLSDIFDKQKTYPFILAACQITKSTEDLLEVTFEENPEVFYNGPTRDLISNPNGEFAKKGCWRWAAGGTMNIYRQGDTRLLPLFHKDSAAPTYGNHVAISSGLADDYAQWFNMPHLMYREGLEEMAVMVDGKVVRFNAGPRFEDLFWNINNYHKLRLVHQGVNVHGSCDGYIHRAKMPGEKTLRIVCQLIGGGTRVVEHRGLVNIDEKTRGIDLLRVQEIEIPEGEVRFMDCESSPRGFLDRDVFVYHADSLRKANQYSHLASPAEVHKTGLLREPAGESEIFPTVPVLQTCLEAFCKS